MTAPVIEIRDLVKRYGETAAVDHVNLVLRRGEIFGLLGPNGAGKTTTILTLLGLTEPSAGAVRVLGHDPAREPLEVKRRVGYLPDAVGFYDNLSARENLRYTGRLLGLERRETDARISEALERVGLERVGDHKVQTFSRGMRQRLGLAEIRLKRAEIAILDEPTSALDPQATDEILAMIHGLKSEGVTVLLSSHLLDQVQKICDRVALFSAGRIALMGSVAELSAQVLGGGFQAIVEAGDGAAAVLKNLDGVGRIVADGGGLHLYAERDLRADIARALVAANIPLLRLSRVEPSLDEIYRRYFEGVRHAA